MRKIILGLALIGTLFAASVGVARTVLADYTGPNRTHTETRYHNVVLSSNTSYYICTYIYTCGDNIGNIPGVRCSSGVCQSLAIGSGYYTVKPVTVTTTDPPATADASFQCGTPGNNGWCRGGANLVFTANEPVSGYVISAIETNLWGYICQPNTASPTCTYDPGDGTGTVTFWAESTYGDSSTQGTVSWKVDATAPVLAPSAPAPDGQNGWFVTTPVSVDASGSDATSGLASLQCRADNGAWQSPPVAVTGDGTHAVDCQAVDNAGNVSTWSSTVKVDTTAPTASPATSGTMGDNGWYTSAAIVQANASDSASGVASVQHQVDGGAWQNGSSVSVSDGTHTVVFRVTDEAGNVTTSQPVVVKVDTTAPALDISVPAPDGQGGWYVSSPVSVGATGSDATSGLASLTCSVDGGAWQAPPVDVAGDGVHTVTCRAEDNAGNVTQRQTTVSIDATAPTLSPAMPSPDGRNGWFVTAPVSVGASGSDATSGVASTQCRVDGGAWQSPPVSVSADGVHTVDCQVVDNAGNTTTWSDTVSVDTAPPVSAFSTPAEGAKVWGVVMLQGTSADVTSGASSAEVSTDGGATWKPMTVLASGQWTAYWDTRALPDGDYTLMARAQDEAGNEEHTAIVHVTVANAPPQIRLAPQTWYFWQTAQAEIVPNPYIPLKSVTVEVLGEPGYIRRWEYGNVQRVNIRWNSRWYSETGPWAHPGTYRVVVEAVDIYGHGSQVEGRVIVPEPALTATPTPTATFTPTPTDTPTPTVTATFAPPTATAAPPISPTPTPQRAVGAVQASLPPSEEHPAVLWLFGAVLVVGLSLTLDPRPREVRALTKSLAHLLEDDHD